MAAWTSQARWWTMRTRRACGWSRGPSVQRTISWRRTSATTPATPRATRPARSPKSSATSPPAWTASSPTIRHWAAPPSLNPALLIFQQQGLDVAVDQLGLQEGRAIDLAHPPLPVEQEQFDLVVIQPCGLALVVELDRGALSQFVENEIG